MLGKFEFYWFFHGLVISEENINKNNTRDLLGVVVKYVVVHFLRKKLVFWPKFAAFCWPWSPQILFGVGGI